MHSERVIRQSAAARRNFRRYRRRRCGNKGPIATVVLILGVISALGLAVFGVVNGGFDVGTHSAWRDLVHTYREAGEPVYFEDVVPPPLPDEHNFFASPVFYPIANTNREVPSGLLGRALHPGRGLQVSRLLAAAASSPGGASLDSIASILLQAGLTDPNTDFLQPGDRVLAAINQLGLDFSPLIVTADRTGSRFPIDYNGSLFPTLPHLPYLEAVGDWLAIKAISEVSVGNADAAVVDSLLIWRLAEALSAEPFLSSQQTRRKLLGLFASCIRVGIQRGVWSDEQLAAFASALENNPPLVDLSWALRGERAQLNSYVHDTLSAHEPTPSEEITAMLGEDVSSSDIRKLRHRQVAANYAYQYLLDRIKAQPIDAVNLLPGPQLTAELPPSAIDHLEQLSQETSIFTQVQVLLAQTEIACALERFRFAFGAFPDKLEELQPAWIDSIPHDPLTGKPFVYMPLDTGGYTIKCPGWPAPEGKSAKPWNFSRSTEQ